MKKEKLIEFLQSNLDPEEDVAWEILRQQDVNENISNDDWEKVCFQLNYKSDLTELKEAAEGVIEREINKDLLEAATTTLKEREDKVFAFGKKYGKLISQQNVKNIISLFEEEHGKLDHSSIDILKKDLQCLADECEGNATRSTPDSNYFAYLFLTIEGTMNSARSENSGMCLDGNATEGLVNGITSVIKTSHPGLGPKKQN